MTKEDPYSHLDMDQRLETWRVGVDSINVFANSTLKGLLILNGGAAIAILAFLGQVLSRAPDATKFSVAGFVCPLMIFGLGCFAPLLRVGWDFYRS